jgi:hypothetical protein
MKLAELLEIEADELEGVDDVVLPDGTRTWSRTGRPFATVSADGTVAEFALDPAVSAAAIRTPDTSPSARGAGWVAFAPLDLDDHAADRATAWFASAYRRLSPRN